MYSSIECWKDFFLENEHSICKRNHEVVNFISNVLYVVDEDNLKCIKLLVHN